FATFGRLFINTLRAGCDPRLREANRGNIPQLTQPLTQSSLFVTRTQRWLANSALVLGACLVPLAAIEIGLRVAGTVPPSMYEVDSTLLYRLVPGGRKTFTHKPVNGGA